MSNSQFTIQTSPAQSSGPYSAPQVAPSTNPGFGDNIQTYVPGGVASYHGEQPNPADTGVLQTLRTTSGAPANPFTATDKHLVEVNGMQTPVATAIRMGYIARHPATGALMETGKLQAESHHSPVASPNAQQPHQQAAQGEDITMDTPMSRGVTNMNDIMFSQVPSGLMVRAVLENTERGHVAENTVNSIASSLQITPEEAAELLRTVGQGREDQRSRALSKLGIDDVQEFDDFIRSKHPDLLRKAQTAHFLSGDLTPYKALARTYYENLDKIAPERIMSAKFGNGITASLSGDTIVLNVPGKGQMSYAGAVRAGIIRVGA
ncbi:hypothetical protein [Camelimonas lactis]|uniref:Uncharacterized protein n=1 Tax=Camelimonas lactis TaxID=659006 RepID=A0A4R2GTV5_9HYPH|nr:hypothetical protein [Camelimonas lactis]TCO14071.1 hypothetical protein EV666_10421 [Camelimonas lactis]